jgi:hypothetical protein
MTEAGVSFSHVLMAVNFEANHTGCIYLGVFDKTNGNPLVSMAVLRMPASHGSFSPTVVYNLVIPPRVRAWHRCAATKTITTVIATV